MSNIVFGQKEQIHWLKQIVQQFQVAEQGLSTKCREFAIQNDLQGIQELMKQKKRISARIRALTKFLGQFEEGGSV